MAARKTKRFPDQSSAPGPPQALALTG